MNFRSLVAASALTVVSTSSFAHFQMIQADNDNYLRDKGGKVTLSMPFTHPSHGAPTMSMAKPEKLTLTHKNNAIDLTGQMQALDWQGADGEQAKAWQVETKFRKLGDYVLTLEPAPYLEESEDAYIQQFTKVIYNVGGLPTGWDEAMNLSAEIVPDQAPYAVYAGGTFSGVVMANGKPKPYAEIEVEYLNHKINADRNGFDAKGAFVFPEHMNILTIKADQNGRFIFGVPTAGFWGFAALGVGEKTEHEGKELSQDAVLWIQAHELKQVK